MLLFLLTLPSATRTQNINIQDKLHMRSSLHSYTKRGLCFASPRYATPGPTDLTTLPFQTNKGLKKETPRFSPKPTREAFLQRGKGLHQVRPMPPENLEKVRTRAPGCAQAHALLWSATRLNTAAFRELIPFSSGYQPMTLAPPNLSARVHPK